MVYLLWLNSYRNQYTLSSNFSFNFLFYQNLFKQFFPSGYCLLILSRLLSLDKFLYSFSVKLHYFFMILFVNNESKLIWHQFHICPIESLHNFAMDELVLFTHVSYFLFYYETVLWRLEIRRHIDTFILFIL